MSARVLIITTGSTAGGAERQVLYFLKGVDRSRFTPHILTVLSPDSPHRRGGPEFLSTLQELEVPYEALNLNRFPSPGGMSRLRHVLRARHWDIVQSYGIRVDLAVRLLAGAKRPPHLVSSIRGLELQRPQWLFALDGLSSGRVARYIANSHAGKKEFIARARIENTLIEVVHNGLDVDAFLEQRANGDRTRLRAHLQIPDGQLCIAVVANIHEAKGHTHLLEAIRRLRSAGTDVVVILVGTDRTDGALAQEARDLGIANQIRQLGTRTDIASICAASDAMVLPSMHEGMPNALMEGMASSLPVIATNVGGIPELVLEGTTGLLVPRADPESLARAIAQMAKNPELRASMGKSGKSHIQSGFTVHSMVEQTCAIYDDILARSQQ